MDGTAASRKMWERRLEKAAQLEGRKKKETGARRMKWQAEERWKEAGSERRWRTESEWRASGQLVLTGTIVEGRREHTAT